MDKGGIPGADIALKGSLVGHMKGAAVKSGANNPLNAIRNGPIKANIYTATKIAPHKGESSEPPHAPPSVQPEHKKSSKGTKKQRPASPGVFLKSIDPVEKLYANTLKSKNESERNRL